MKHFALILLTILFFSCLEEDKVDYGYGEYYVEMATSLDQKTFLLDCGKTVYSEKEIAGLGEGERVIFNFSYLNKETNEVTIRNIKRVFLGSLQFVETDKIQEYENIPIRLESIWLSSHFLNVRFYMEYYSEAHIVSLYADQSEINNNEIHLYFLHNKNDDFPGYWSLSEVSFDLQKELGNPQGEKTLIVHVVSENYGEKEYRFSY